MHHRIETATSPVSNNTYMIPTLPPTDRVKNERATTAPARSPLASLPESKPQTTRPQDTVFDPSYDQAIPYHLARAETSSQDELTNLTNLDQLENMKSVNEDRLENNLSTHQVQLEDTISTDSVPLEDTISTNSVPLEDTDQDQSILQAHLYINSQVVFEVEGAKPTRQPVPTPRRTHRKGVTITYIRQATLAEET